MKKIILTFIAITCCMCISAQTMKLYKSGQLVKEFAVSEVDSIVFAEGKTPETDANLLPGKFSVSALKQVLFTKSNLYWDGSAFKFEKNQTDFPSSWNANHVGHFYWTNTTDYQTTGKEPFAETYAFTSQSIKDKFWCGKDNQITVEGTDGLFALTGNNNGEWYYLFMGRNNAENLYKVGVTVGGVENCVIIAPDDFTGNLRTYYSLDELNSLGLVCLPPTGYREGTSIDLLEGLTGCYWSASPCNNDISYAENLETGNMSVSPCSDSPRSRGYSVRLVKLASTPEIPEYVDLGLPSGTLWATCNIGAENPEESGLYFAWGETTGYSGDTSDGHSFEWANYKWMQSGQSSQWGCTKYTFPDNYTSGCWYMGSSYVGTTIDGITYRNLKKLQAEDDAATAILGEEWCIPTSEQQSELVNSSYTTSTWTTQNGVYGRLITSKMTGYTDKSIFLPAAGYIYFNNLVRSGIGGYYWSSELTSYATMYANRLGFTETGIDNSANNTWDRCYGRSIRAVRVK